MLFCLTLEQVLQFVPEELDNISVPTIVKFYNPDCPYCKAFAADYEEFSNLTKVRVAELDCIQFSKYCADHMILNYPTITLYVPTKDSV